MDEHKTGWEIVNPPGHLMGCAYPGKSNVEKPSRMIQDSTRTSLNLLLNISRELAGLSDLPSMLARVLSLSVEAIGAERGTLIVLDARQQPLDAAIIYRGQLVPHTMEQLTVTLERGLAGWVLRHREPVLVNDTSKDERWVRRPDDSVQQSGSKSALCVPLLVREQLNGVLTIVHPNPGSFTEDHLALLQTIAELAAIAVHNARLYDSLNAARKRYYELFEVSIDPIFITDNNGRILEANRQAEQATGRADGDLISSPIFSLHEPRPAHLAADLANLHNGQSIAYETRLIPASGDPFPVEMYVYRVELEEGSRFQWIARDVSARKRLETLQEDLAAMVYHDLRSPLANVVSSLELLDTLMTEQANQSLAPVVHIAMRSTERVQRLINSLLDIRRLEAGQPITARKQVNLKQLFVEVSEFSQFAIDNKHQKLAVNVEDNLPDLFIDSDMIRRVLVNLLENASKFTPHDGLLATGASRDGDMIRLWVRDTGPGIPEDIREKIFDKFISLQSANMPRGLGLGLAFCRLAVQAHGGRIWVESTVGEGSTFIFTLPVENPA